MKKRYYAALLISAALLFNQGFAQNTSSYGNRSGREENRADGSSPLTKELQSEVVSQKIEEQRKTIMEEAVVALKETRTALQALENNNSKEALAALERATGKLNILLSREPQLALAPVNVTIAVFDLYETPDHIKVLIQQTKRLLNNGDIQDARFIISNLASEVNIRVANIPLATYPEALKLVAPLIDKGETEAAKVQLKIALSTLAIVQHTVPLPYLKTIASLERIDALNEVKNRNEAQNKQIEYLLKFSRDQLETAKVLDYGKKSDLKPLDKIIDQIEKKTKKEEPIKDEVAKAKQHLIDIIHQNV